MSNMNKIGVTV